VLSCACLMAARELPAARHLHTNKPGPLIFQPSLSTGSSPASNRPLTRRYNHSLGLLSFVITNRNNSFIIKAGPSAMRNPAGARSRGFNDVDPSPGPPVPPNVSRYSSKKKLRFGVRSKKARLSRKCRRWFSFFHVIRLFRKGITCQRHKNSFIVQMIVENWAIRNWSSRKYIHEILNLDSYNI
jgi:hypothetical protein